MKSLLHFKNKSLSNTQIAQSNSSSKLNINIYLFQTIDLLRHNNISNVAEKFLVYFQISSF